MGIRGKRPSVTFGRKLPKRVVCPECGKKGVTQWKVTMYGDVCDCQYCCASWTRAGWARASKTKVDPGIEHHFDRFLTGPGVRVGVGSILDCERAAFYAGYRAATARSRQ